MQREVFVMVYVRHQSEHLFVARPGPFCNTESQRAHRKEQVVAAHSGSVEDFHQDPGGMWCHDSGGGEVFRGERSLVQAWCGGNLERRSVATDEFELQVDALFEEAGHLVAYARVSCFIVR